MVMSSDLLVIQQVAETYLNSIILFAKSLSTGWFFFEHYAARAHAWYFHRQKVRESYLLTLNEEECVALHVTKFLSKRSLEMLTVAHGQAEAVRILILYFNNGYT